MEVKNKFEFNKSFLSVSKLILFIYLIYRLNNF